MEIDKTVKDSKTQQNSLKNVKQDNFTHYEEVGRGGDTRAILLGYEGGRECRLGMNLQG